MLKDRRYGKIVRLRMLTASSVIWVISQCVVSSLAGNIDPQRWFLTCQPPRSDFSQCQRSTWLYLLTNGQGESRKVSFANFFSGALRSWQRGWRKVSKRWWGSWPETQVLRNIRFGVRFIASAIIVSTWIEGAKLIFEEFWKWILMKLDMRWRKSEGCLRAWRARVLRQVYVIFRVEEVLLNRNLCET